MEIGAATSCQSRKYRLNITEEAGIRDWVREEVMVGTADKTGTDVE
jgi:hypothetical protein